MSTTTDTNATAPKVGKYGSAPDMMPRRLCSNLSFGVPSATWKLWPESQQNHLGFVTAYAGESSLDTIAYR